MESSKETNYWPGFVDALTNTVIAMVFLVIVLTLSLTVFVNAVVKQRLARQLASDANCKVVAAADPIVQVSPPDKAKGGAPAPKDRNLLLGDLLIPDGSNATLERDAIALKQVAMGTLLLRFSGKNVEMDDATAAKIADLAKNEGIVPSLVAVQVDVRGHELYLTENQRVAYFRSMSVRNALLKQGVHPHNISVRLVEAPLEDAGVVSVYFMKPGTR